MKNIVITGASKGIGFETAKRLAEEGHSVFALARTEEKLQSLKSYSPDRIHTFTLDLTDEKDLSDCINQHFQDLKIDVLINNAGALINKPFMELEASDWNKMLNVNLISAVSLIKCLKPNLKGGHILNIGSMGGYQGSSKFPGLSAYSAAKSALAVLSECLSVEFLDDNIAVNCLALGAVQTEMLNEAFPGYQAPLSAEDMATFISDFAINGSRFFNGKILPVALQNPS